MTLEKATKILKYHNVWRRGAEIEMTNAKDLGIAIDVILEHLDESIKQQYVNTKTQEICYKVSEYNNTIFFKHEYSNDVYKLPFNEFHKQFAPILKG